MTKANRDKYFSDPVDGLRVERIGEWSSEKHARLQRYVRITRATRRKYDTSGSTYIDLYCGPGRAQVNDNLELVDGSALVAAGEALSRDPFTTIHIGDVDAGNLAACAARLEKLGVAQVCSHSGDAKTTAAVVAKALHPDGLHLAFLDPYSLGQLPFDVIRSLATLKRMDLLIHFSWMDLQRNLRAMIESGEMERVAPGCVATLDLNRRDDLLRLDVFRYWVGLLEKLGYQVSDRIERVAGPKNQLLYRLVLAAKHAIADKFWKEVANVQPQRNLFGN